MKTVACGQCYRWAYQYVRQHPGALLVHGTVSAEAFGEGRRIDHAWVIHDGLVKDWQTMVAGFGGNWSGKGYPWADYREVWSARPEEEYTNETLWDAVARGAKEAGSMHYGPWHKNPAYPAMLAHDWTEKGQPDPAGYWASEKYDGVRALWDGETFYSRTGKIFHAPQWYKDTLPKTPLDGELWLERSVAGFQKGVGIVKRLKGGEAWRDITYIVFDIPTSTEPFEKVQAKLKRMDLGPYSHVAPQYRVKSESDMLRRYEEALAEGAEGIMLREPRSRYVPKRTMALLKVKPKDSAEAVVIGYTAGKGRHEGRMGALRVHLLGDKSKEFKVGGGFKDAERDERLYPLGTIVEVNFNDKTAAGLPRFPRFHRVRTDLMADRPKAAPKAKPKAAPKAKPRGRRVLFSGSRHWSDEAPVRRIIESLPPGSTVVHGGARGLDSVAGRLAAKRGLKVEVHPADWSQGRGAGPARNQDMVDLGADAVYAFPVEGSKGTWDLVRRAEAAGLRVMVHETAPTPKAKPKPKPKPKAKPKAAPKRSTQDYFSMSTPQLVALGDAGSRTELTRRGRDPATGKKRR